MKKLILLLSIIALTSCQSKNWSLRHVKTVEGFDVPESMVYDEESQMVYISNMETATKGYWENDQKSFISLMSPDGQVQNMRWLNSSSNNVLNSTKGLTILDGYLYFADNTELKRCRISQPNKVDVFKLPKALKLNDVANDGESILVTDTAQGVIYRFFPETGTHKVIPAPKTINGITYDNGQYYAVSFGEHEVYEIDITGETAPVPFGLADNFTNLDGIEVLDDGTFIISDVKGHAIFSVSADRKTVKKLATLTWAADIGIDRQRKLLFVPSLTGKKIAIYQLTAE
jgi:hypothetical protein